MYNRKLVFAAACAGIFLFGIMLITLGSILPSLTQKFGLDEMSAGKLASIFPIGILIGSLIFGPIADRYGYKILLIISTLLVVLSFESLAYAETILLLQASMFVIGLSGGIMNGATNAVAADISDKDKGANLSLLGVFFGIGALGMPLLLSLLSKYFSYTTILSAIGFFMLLPAVYFAFIRFPIPKQVQGFPIKEAILLLKQSSLMLTAFFLFFQSGAEALVNNWTTTFLNTKLEMEEKNALFVLSLYVAGMTVTRLLLGNFLKKISSFLVMLISIFLVLIGCLILFYSSSHQAAIAALIIIGAGLAAGFPVVLGYIGQLYANLSGTAFSIALVIALTGNTIINYFFGMISHTYSIKQLPLVLGIVSVCMLLLIIAIRQNISSKIKL